MCPPVYKSISTDDDQVPNWDCLGVAGGNNLLSITPPRATSNAFLLQNTVHLHFYGRQWFLKNNHGTQTCLQYK